MNRRSLNVWALIEEFERRNDAVRSQFQITICKKCGTTRLAPSWDVDFASMVNKVGQPHSGLYLSAYLQPTLQLHATLISAFAHEPKRASAEKDEMATADFSLFQAMMLLVLMVMSQDLVFSLGLDSELRTAWDAVTKV